MSIAKKMNFGTKIIIIVVAVFLASFMINFLFIKEQVHEDAIETLTAKARSLTLKAENARQYIAELRSTHDVFRDAEMLAEIEEKMRDVKTEDERIQRSRELSYYWTIPIVASWIIGDADAEAEGYEFRVAKIDARNPDREANEIERFMLDKMEEEGLEEYVTNDRSINSLRFMRPIILDESCMLCHGNVEDYPPGNGYDPLGFKMENWEAGEQHGAFQIIADLTPVDQSIRNMLNRMLILLAAIILIVILLIAYMVKRLAINPVRNIRDLLSQISDGDLTVQGTTKTDDDIGQTVNALNKMSGILSEVVGNVKTASRNLLTESTELSSGAEEISQMTTEQAGIMKELTASIQTNTDQSRSTAQVASMAVEGVQQGQTAVSRTIEAMQKIANRVTIIEDIAFQTDLLAINATIEAAHAGGDIGRSFEVVARQVRDLATRSKEAALEISELSEDSMDISREAGVLFKRFVDDIRKTAEMINGIMESTISQKESVGQVNIAIQQSAKASEEIASMAERLLKQAKVLEEDMRFFRISGEKSRDNVRYLENKKR